MTVRLSICIPTYNRAAFLEEALASIERMRGSDAVEIVVADNASQDHTAEVVTRFGERHPNLRYFRWEQNQGADRNFLKVIELAGGDYCWLLGSDDLVCEHALEELLPMLDGSDIVLLDYTLMSFDMKRVIADRRALDAPAGSVLAIRSPADFHDYLVRCRELSGLFAYISTIVVRRAAWNSFPDRQDFIGSAWIHVTKLLDIFRHGGSVKYAGRPLVLNRSGNDSFLAEVGHTRRTLIDLDYVRICQRVFEDQPDLRRHFMARLAGWFFSWHGVLGAKHAIALVDGRKGLDIYGPRLFSSFEGERQHCLKRIAWRWMPISVLRVMRVFDRLRRGLPVFERRTS